jgi:hypothetical protein
MRNAITVLLLWLLMSGPTGLAVAQELGASDFKPSVDHPIGFRGDGTHNWPGAVRPPMRWNEGLFEGPDNGIKWRTPLHKSNGQAIVVGSRVFALEEPNVLVCLEAETGRVLWREECDHLELFPHEKQQRGRELLQYIQDTKYRHFGLITEYDWLRGEVWRERNTPLRAESDDPEVQKRLKEIEEIYLKEGFSRRRDTNGNRVTLESC